MAPSDRPLLAGSRTASENEEEREATEEDALLTNPWRSAQDNRHPGWWHWFVLGWAFLATIAVLVLAVLYQHTQSASPKPSNNLEPYRPSGKRNLIFMVTDGMGPASLSLTRSYRQYTEGLPINDILTLDEHLIGSSRTRSSSSLVTDSAAGATAFSCGKKSYNGAISVLPNGDPCGTVLEAAKRAGYMTGLVVTTRITDATPATFASHVHVREEEDSIARQLIGDTHPLGHVVDLMLGGGRCFFLPNSTSSSCRSDDVDVTATAQDQGYSYISTREEFDALETGNAAKLPLLGLFADTDIPFEIDRRTASEIYPSLDEMARTALNALSIATQNSDKGFFLLIEGSRIDHAGHENDPAAQVHEVLAFDKTFTSVLEYLDKSNIEGVAVSTSDHETGGLSVARQLHRDYPDYLWHPKILAKAQHSATATAHHLQSLPQPVNTTYIADLLSSLGIDDASPSELETIQSFPHTYTIADLISRRAQVGWSTHGHSAVDVNVYASDISQARELVGNNENTDIGKFLRGYLGLEQEVEDVERELGDKMGKVLGKGAGKRRVGDGYH